MCKQGIWSLKIVTESIFYDNLNESCRRRTTTYWMQRILRVFELSLKKLKSIKKKEKVSWNIVSLINTPQQRSIVQKSTLHCHLNEPVNFVWITELKIVYFSLCNPHFTLNLTVSAFWCSQIFLPLLTILIELLHSVKLWFITQFKPKSVRVRQLKWLHAVFPVICSAGAIICQSRKECIYMVAQANHMPALILEVVIFNGFGRHVWFQAPLLTVFGFRVICWNPTHRVVFPFKTSCKHVRLVACEASLNYHNTRCFTLMHAEGRNGAAFILVIFTLLSPGLN